MGLGRKRCGGIIFEEKRNIEIKTQCEKYVKLSLNYWIKVKDLHESGNKNEDQNL